MRRTVLGATGLVLVAAVTAWMLLGRGGERLAIDLLETLPSAKDIPESYEIVDLEIAGDTRRALLPDDYERAIWNVTVPGRAWLHFAIALHPDGWAVEGDGVLFMVGVSNGEVYDDVFNLVVNPSGNPADRVWHDLAIDLSHYAGQNVDLIFNVRRRDTEAGDRPAWGAPRILVH